MPFNVNTNFGSLVAQNNTAKTEGALNKAMTRLSSGLRVNGAADDAAGLAIAKTMSKQVSGYEVNVRNANDAVSLLQVAEGGMDEIGNMLQRMKDLALQSSNGTNSAAQRANMDLEYQQLVAEIDRVVNTTEFNGLNLLDGSSIQSTNFQVDESNTANTDTIQVTINNVNSTALAADVGTNFATGIQATDLFDANGSVTITADLNGSGTAGDQGSGTDTFTINVTTATTAQSFVDMVNAESANHLVSASISNGNLVIFQNNVNDGSNVDSVLTVATAADIGGQAIATTNIAIAGNSQALNGSDITTEANAGIAIGVLDGAITTITSERAQIGASQNRFEKSINNLNNKIVNVSAAMGRIMDADFGKETAEFSKQSIIQQAGISMMAQAKSMPQQLLSLLQ